MASPVFICLAWALVAAQFVVPRRLAFLPLLIGVVQFQSTPVIQPGVSFSVCKLVIVAGLWRAWRERALVWTTRQPLDVLMALWAGWMFLSGWAHHPPDHNPITIRLSVIFNYVGGYLYARAFLKDREAFLRFIQCLAVVVLPLALLVFLEKSTIQNLYGVIGGGMAVPEIRGGRVRAAGPFGHAILLGTFAATSIPLLMALWQRRRCLTLAGLAACGLIVICSGSSGPIVTLFFGLLGVTAWAWRTNVGWIRKLAVLGLVLLQLIMQAPVWYLMARIDLAGGSTGWHRAQLITSAINYFDEWWLVGTDYTKHWLGYTEKTGAPQLPGRPFAHSPLENRCKNRPYA